MELLRAVCAERLMGTAQAQVDTACDGAMELLVEAGVVGKPEAHGAAEAGVGVGEGKCLGCSTPPCLCVLSICVLCVCVASVC